MGAAGCSTPCGDIDGLLRLDLERHGRDYERFGEQKTARQSNDVPQVMVVYAGQHHRYLWVLFHQFNALRGR